MYRIIFKHLTATDNRPHILHIFSPSVWRKQRICSGQRQEAHVHAARTALIFKQTHTHKHTSERNTRGRDGSYELNRRAAASTTHIAQFTRQAEHQSRVSSHADFIGFHPSSSSASFSRTFSARVNKIFPCCCYPSEIRCDEGGGGWQQHIVAIFAVRQFHSPDIRFHVIRMTDIYIQTVRFFPRSFSIPCSLRCNLFSTRQQCRNDAKKQFIYLLRSVDALSDVRNEDIKCCWWDESQMNKQEKFWRQKVRCNLAAHRMCADEKIADDEEQAFVLNEVTHKHNQIFV